MTDLEAAVRAVTFDATGTLFHSPRLGEIYSSVLGRHGVAVCAPDCSALIRRVWVEFDCAAEPGRDRFAGHPQGAAGWWKTFLDRLCAHLSAKAPPFASAELYERFARAEAWEVFPEVEAVVGRLRDTGLRLGVVSNWDERLPRLLDVLGLGRFFEVVAYSQTVGVEKPHPAIFEHALECLGVEPGAAVHVGDRQRHDVEGAEAVGMRALRLDRSGGRGIGSLEEVIDRVRES